MRAGVVGRAVVVAVLGGTAALACSDLLELPPGPTADTRPVAARTLSPLPDVPPDPTNAVADNADAAKLGQMLFFDKSFSGQINVAATVDDGALGAQGESGRISCASCHMGAALDDRRSKPGNVSLGTGYGTRRALPLVNASFYTWSNWGGRFDSQWSLALSVAENDKPGIMSGTRLQIVHAIYAKYKAEYEAIFPALDPRLDPSSPRAADFPPSGKPTMPAYDQMVMADRLIVDTIYANYGKAIAAYLRLLVSRDSAFDKYAAGDTTAISESAQRGLGVFTGKGACIGCHNGPHFSDGEFHALGVPQTGLHVPAQDFGRFNDLGALIASKPAGVDAGLAPPDPSLKGQFRTKSLRGVALNGPYMHAGQFATLEDVVAFYNKGGGDPPPGVVKDAKLNALGLTPQESADLVALLNTLTGAPVPPALTVDTSKP